MKNVDQSPLWVKLVYANVGSRKTALWLVASCVIFTLYCLPWARFSPAPLVKQIFLIDDWEWFLSMMPMTIWYGLALRWVDQHDGW